jgi:CheY-like chemotaxis protein
MKCLLIDDDPDDQDFFAFALQDIIPEVSLQTANNGIEAITALRTQELSPDVIFIDINMPRMDGWQCLREIRELSKFNTVPVFMYSTSDYAAGKYPLSEDNFTEYLTKQNGIDALAGKLSEIFKKLRIK